MNKLRVGLLFVLILWAHSAFATTYYVSSSGSDFNSCTAAQSISTPKQHLGNLNSQTGGPGAVSCLAAGDTLYVRSGTYNSEVIYAPVWPFPTPPMGDYLSIIPNGTDNTHRTTVALYPGDAPGTWNIPYADAGNGGINFFFPQNLTISGFKIDATIANFDANVFSSNMTDGLNVTISNFELFNCPNNCLSINSANGNGLTNILVSNGHVHHNGLVCNFAEFPLPLGCAGEHLLYMRADDKPASQVVFDNMEFDHSPGVQDGSLGTHQCNGVAVSIFDYTGTGSSADDTTFRNSYVHDSYGAIGIDGGQNVKVYNNLFVNNGTPTGQSNLTCIPPVDIGAYGTFTANPALNVNTQLYNNVIYNTTTNTTNTDPIDKLNTDSLTSNAKVANNIVWNNAAGDLIGASLRAVPGYTGNTNLCSGAGGCSLYMNPQFVNAAGNNYHLTSISPAISAGVNLSSIFTTDKDGNTRPPVAAWDIGPYQFIPMGCSSTPLGNGVTCIVSGSAGSTNGNTVSLTGIRAAGSTAAIVVVSQGVAGTPCTPTSTPTNTWVPLSVSSDGTRKNQVFVASPPIAVSNSMSVSCNGTGTGPALSFGGYTGLLTSQNPTDKTAVGNNGAGSTTLTLGPVTPINANQLLLVGWNENTGLSLAPNNGFAQIESVLHTANNAGVGFAVKTIGASAASSVTLTAASSDIINGTLASFATNLNGIFTITQQPTTLISGSTFSPTIAGSLVAGIVGDNIALSSVSGTATPTGTLNVTTTSGGAFSFPGVGATGTPSTGNVWKICDTTNALNPCLNLNGFTIQGSFSITQQPTTVYSGYAFSPAISGTISTGAAGDTIVISSVSGTANPTGTLNVLTTSGGAFSFPGTGATGTPSNGNIWKVCDSTNSLIPCQNLSGFNLLAPFTTITQQPTSINGGSTFPSAIAATLTPATSNSYTLSLNAPCGTVALTGTLTVTSNMTTGAFSFAGVGATGTGINCVGLIHNNANSAVVDVLTNSFSVCTPDHLTFISQPVNASPGASLGNVSVGVSDNVNNLCASDSGRSITFSNTAGQCMGMTLNGTTTGNNSAGIFLSSNLNETGASGACKLHAASSGLTATDSNTFNIFTSTGTATRIRIK